MILKCKKCGKEKREPQPELVYHKCCGEKMTCELKTLKDFVWDKRIPDEYGYFKSMTEEDIKKELRQEAIKRIKACEKPVDFTRSDRCGTNGNYCEICEREIWFNNLTEKEMEE